MDAATIHRRRWAILGVLVICLLVVILDNTILNVALKTIQETLGASQSQMQWSVDSYALVFAGLLITAGVLGDRLGRKKVLLFGMLAFGATSALCSFAGSPTQLILFRALMGIGAAAVQPQTLSIIQNVFEPEERGKAIGIWAGGSGMAIALGPIAGGALIKYFWWGSVFLVNVPIVIVGVVAILWLVPESRDPKPGRLDPAGVLLSMVALVVLVYGVIQGGNSNHWLRWNTAGAIVLGVALLAVFVRMQARSTHPTIDVHLFRNRQFSAGAGSLALTFFALQGGTFILAFFLQAVRDYTPLAAGFALVAVAAGVMITAPQTGRLVERLGARVVAGTGLLLFGAALAAYSLTTETSPQWAIEVIMYAMGTGMGLTMGPATTSVMSAVPRDKAGAGSAVNNTVRQVAGALGVAVLGSLLAVFFRSDFGAGSPAQLAARLPQPAATRVAAGITSDASESIGGALEYAGHASAALAAANAPAQAYLPVETFVQHSKDSYVSAMHHVSLAAGGFAALGSVVAFTFLPGRPRREEHTTHHAGRRVDELAVADLV